MIVSDHWFLAADDREPYSGRPSTRRQGQMSGSIRDVAADFREADAIDPGSQDDSEKTSHR